MAKYHIGKDGNPHICKATPGQCPLGGEHYDSLAKATAAAEQAAIPREDSTSTPSYPTLSSVVHQHGVSFAREALSNELPSNYRYRIHAGVNANQSVRQRADDGDENAAIVAHNGVMYDLPDNSAVLVDVADNSTADLDSDAYAEHEGVTPDGEPYVYRTWDVGHADDDALSHVRHEGESERVASDVLDQWQLDENHRPTDNEAKSLADDMNARVRSKVLPPADLKNSMTRVRAAYNRSLAKQKYDVDSPSPGQLDAVSTSSRFGYRYIPIDVIDGDTIQAEWDDRYDDDDKGKDKNGTGKDDDGDQSSDGGRRDTSGFIDYSHPDTYKGTKDFLGAFGWDGSDV